MTTVIPDHWNQHAQQWQHVGSPLRPDPLDIEFLEDFLANCELPTPLRAVLLGVTPEIASMQWPQGTTLTAIDRNQAMIDQVWPHDRLLVSATAMSGDWRAVPCTNRSVDCVVGDGCFTLLPYPDGYDECLREIHRILKPDGYFLIRHFIRPELPESLDLVFSDLLNGKIGNFHIFKWRLAMALHSNLEEGVCVDQIWQAWNNRQISPQDLSAQLNWPLASIQTINNYRGVETRYRFPTLTEIKDESERYFKVIDCKFMQYELADCCPTLILRP